MEQPAGPRLDGRTLPSSWVLFGGPKNSSPFHNRTAVDKKHQCGQEIQILLPGTGSVSHREDNTGREPALLAGSRIIFRLSIQKERQESVSRIEPECDAVDLSYRFLQLLYKQKKFSFHFFIFFFPEAGQRVGAYFGTLCAALIEHRERGLVRST
jgi:hypothetical protein